MELDERQIKDIIVQALKEHKEEEKKIKKKGVLRNTKLLMKNYRSLKDHCENAKDNIHDVEKDIIVFKDLDDFELYIKSIMRSKARTLIMVSHIDTALKVLKENQSEKGTLEKYEAIQLYYIEKRSFEYVAEILNCGTNTTRRWVNEMLNELGVLLFGVDGLKTYI